MSRIALVLMAFYLATKLLVRWWWFRPAHMRPGFIRHNEAVRTFDMIAVLALIGLFFFLINTSSLPKTLLVTAALLVYDFILRAIFLHLEAKRICAASPKWRYREARRRVRNRVRRATTV